MRPFTINLINTVTSSATKNVSLESMTSMPTSTKNEKWSRKSTIFSGLFLLILKERHLQLNRPKSHCYITFNTHNVHLSFVYFNKIFCFENRMLMWFIRSLKSYSFYTCIHTYVNLFTCLMNHFNFIINLFMYFLFLLYIFFCFFIVRLYHWLNAL